MYMKIAIYIIPYVLFIFFFISCDSITDTIHFSKNEKSVTINKLSSNNVTKVIFDESGTVISVSLLFSDNKLISEWNPVYNQLSDSIEYYGNGQIKAKGYVKDGKSHSHWSYFDRKGNLSVDRYFSYGKPTNIWLWYDTNGDVMKYEIFNHIKDDGNFTKYFINGKIKEKRNYVNTKLEGEYKLFYDNSTNSKKLEGYYQQGTRIGVWYQFDELGISNPYYHYIVN